MEHPGHSDRALRPFKLQFFQLLPLGFKRHLPGNGFQLAQRAEPQKLLGGPSDRFDVVIKSGDLLVRGNFLSGYFNNNTHGSVFIAQGTS